VSAATSALAGIAGIVTNPDKRREVEEELKNALRSTPKGLETPKYRVVRTLGMGGSQVELRTYEPFTVVRREMAPGNGMASAGEGFNSLASYLFGGNEEKQAMEMTMPVEIRSGATSSMSFVLPRANAKAPPTPLIPDVKVETVGARMVAVKSFRGIVTDEETERQREALLEALLADDYVVVTNPDEYSVLQYNSPFTIPWRRRNELAMGVEPSRADDSAEAEGEAATTTGSDSDADSASAGVISWFDAGIRLTS